MALARSRFGDRSPGGIVAPVGVVVILALCCPRLMGREFLAGPLPADPLNPIEVALFPLDIGHQIASREFRLLPRVRVYRPAHYRRYR